MKTYLLFLSVLVSCSSVKPSKPVTNQLLSDLEALSSDKFEGRKTGTRGNQLAREYIAKRFKDLNLTSLSNEYIQEFDVKTKENNALKGYNIIASIPGKNPSIIVISAHYDHLGIINNEVYNGADDNASGVSALLFIAEYFSVHQPENTLVFAAFDAEEMGLQGARAFVNQPPVELSKIKLNINMDMISHNDKNELFVAGTFLYPQLKPFLITTNPEIKILTGHDDPKLGKSEDWTSQSDHAAFNEKNIPFLYFGVEDHKDYHQATDEYQHINKPFFVNAAGAILKISKNIDGDNNLQKIFRDKLLMKKQ